MQAVSQLYIPDRLSRASQLYGTFGATIVTLGWFFILGRAIVLGIVCNAVIHERFGSITNFVFSWPIVACCDVRSWCGGCSTWRNQRPARCAARNGDRARRGSAVVGDHRHDD